MANFGSEFVRRMNEHKIAFFILIVDRSSAVNVLVLPLNSYLGRQLCNFLSNTMETSTHKLIGVYKVGGSDIPMWQYVTLV